MRVFLSIQQHYILDTLRKLGCLRQSQLYRLVQEEFKDSVVPISEKSVAVMLRQLRATTWNVRLEGDLVLWAGADKNYRYLEAIDVMLELSRGIQLDYALERKAPALLSFSLKGKNLRLFSVVALTDFLRPGDIERRRMERIIWISESGRFPKSLRLPPKELFAARQKDGTHQFYGSTEL